MIYRLNCVRTTDQLTIEEASKLSGITESRWRELERGKSEMTEEELYRAAITLGVSADIIMGKQEQRTRYARNQSSLKGHKGSGYGYDLTLETAAGTYKLQLNTSSGNALFDFPSEEEDGYKPPFLFGVYGMDSVWINWDNVLSWTIVKSDADAIPDSAYELYAKYQSGKLQAETRPFAEEIMSRYDFSQNFDALGATVIKTSGDVEKYVCIESEWNECGRHRWTTYVATDSDGDSFNISPEDDDVVVIAISEYSERFARARRARRRAWHDMALAYMRAGSEKVTQDVLLEWKSRNHAPIVVKDEREFDTPWCSIGWRDVNDGAEELARPYESVGHVRTAENIFAAETDDQRILIAISAICQEIDKSRRKDKFGALPWTIAEQIDHAIRFGWHAKTSTFIPNRIEDSVFDCEEHRLFDEPQLGDFLDVIGEVYDEIQRNYEVFAFTPRHEWVRRPLVYISPRTQSAECC